MITALVLTIVGTGTVTWLAGFALGRLTKKQQRKTCGHKWMEGQGAMARSLTCTRIAKLECNNAFCTKHCASAGCNCLGNY